VYKEVDHEGTLLRVSSRVSFFCGVKKKDEGGKRWWLGSAACGPPPPGTRLAGQACTPPLLQPNDCSKVTAWHAVKHWGVRCLRALRHANCVGQWAAKSERGNRASPSPRSTPGGYAKRAGPHSRTHARPLMRSAPLRASMHACSPAPHAGGARGDAWRRVGTGPSSPGRERGQGRGHALALGRHARPLRSVLARARHKPTAPITSTPITPPHLHTSHTPTHRVHQPRAARNTHKTHRSPSAVST
jgi:hypothetical protein